MKIFYFPALCSFMFSLAVGVRAQDSLIPGIPPPGYQAFKPLDLKLGFTSPNEIEGFRYFTEGRLRNLRLGVSTRADVRAILQDCTANGSMALSCNFDSDWNVLVAFFGNGSGSSVELMENGKVIEIEYILSPEFIDKVYFVHFHARRKIPLDNAALLSPFSWTGYQKASKDVSSPEFFKVKYGNFRDRYGLEYFIDNGQEFGQNLKVEKKNRQYIAAISYDLPTELLDKMYVEKVK